MALKIGNQIFGDIYVGPQRIGYIYEGSNLVYQYDTGGTTVYPFLTENLISRWAEPSGLTIYQDTSAYNVENGWFLPDNASTNYSLRGIQPGRGYNFTGVEKVTSTYYTPNGEYDIHLIVRPDATQPANYTRIMDGVGNQQNGITITANQVGTSPLQVVTYLSGSFAWSINANTVITDGNVHDIYLKIRNPTIELYVDDVLDKTTTYEAYGAGSAYPLTLGLRPDLTSNEYGGDIYLVEFLDTSGNKLISYNCDEKAGLISYDAAGNGNHGTINLGGSSESSFHITNNLVQSVHNELGYTQVYKAEGVSTSIDVTLADYNIKQTVTIYARHVDEPSGYLFDTTPRTGAQLDGGTTFSATLGTVTKRRTTSTETISTVNMTASSTLNVTQKNTGTDSNVYKGHLTHFIVFRGSLTAAEVDALVAANDYSDAVIIMHPYLIPINSSYIKYIPVNQAIPTQDVLGNTLSANQTGRVRYDAQIKDSNCANFDGVLYGDAGTAIGNTVGVVGDFEITIECDRLGITDSTGQNNGILYFGSFSNSHGIYQLIHANVSQHSILFRRGSTEILDLGDRGVEWPANGKFEIKITKVGTTYTGYIDGVQIDQQIDATARDLTGQKLILGGYYSSSFTYKGILSSVKLVFGGAEYGLYKLSEGNGLTWFNTAANRPANSDASILLNGSADGTQWTTSDVARPSNLLDGYLFNRIYPSPDLGHSGFAYPSGWSWGDAIMEVSFISTEATATQFIFALSNRNTFSEGVSLITFNGNIAYQENSSTVYGFGSYNINTPYTIKIDRAQGKVWLNGIEDTYTPATITDNNQAFFIGARGDGIANNDPGAAQTTSRLNGSVSKFNISGGSFSLNIESDIITNYGSAASVLVPADPSNAGFDVLGNALSFPGSSTAIYPSENTFDRNFADAPELVAAGISQNEDLSYLDFTADSSRFYRDNTTYIDELLSYSDVPEPFIPAEMDASTFEKYTSVRNYLDQ